MGWNAKYALLLLLSTAITYISGIVIQLFNDNLQSKATDNLLFWVIGNKLRQLLGKIQKNYMN